jgi:HEAT repeat protein
MRSFLLGIVLGAVVMAVAGGIALELLREPPAPDHSGTTAAIAPVETRTTGSDPAEVAKGLEGASDATLASTLDHAQFDRDWGGVGGVARALRARAIVKVDPLTGLAETGSGAPSRTRAQPLVALEAEVARRIVILDLRSHDNAATKLIDRAGEDEVAQKLADLFLAEAKGPEFEPTRRDAAAVLALGGSEKSRDVLGRAVKEGGPRGDLAARALGLADDDKAMALLADLLAHDLDPEVRKRALAGIARSSAVARGSAEALPALLRAAREDQDESVRAKAFAVLGGADLARAESVRSLLAQTIKEPSEPVAVRIAAIGAVRAHRATAHATPTDLADALLKTVAAESDGPVRLAAAEALVEIAPASAATALETALNGARDLQVRDALSRALAAAKERGEPPP